MKNGLQWVLIACLGVIYLFASLAVLHPKVSEEYRAHYIDRTSVDWDPPHYRAAPEEEIALSRPGLPEWIAWSYGFSALETRGLWTDGNFGNVAAFVFAQPLDGAFCVEFTAEPARPLRDSFTVMLGAQSEIVQVRSRDTAEYKAQFNDVKGASQLQFVLPKGLARVHDYDPSNGDARRLGLLLRLLKIRSGSCNPAQ